MIKPYYQDEWVTLYNADCLEILNSGTINNFSITFTDPPFSSGARTDAGKSVRGAMRRGAEWDEKWFSHDNMATVGFNFLFRSVCLRLLKYSTINASLFSFIDWRMYPNLYESVESSGWVTKNLLVWDKKHFGMGTNFRNQHELILYAEKGTVEILRHDVGNIIKTTKPQNEYHPTEKPLSLVCDLLSVCAKETDIILDPFAGSGTTLVAAKQLGRKSIGIEISKEYCDIIVKRCSQEVMDL